MRRREMRAPSARKGMPLSDIEAAFRRVSDIAMARGLTGVQQSTSYGTPALRVRAKSIVRLKEADTLVLMCPIETKELTMEAAPDIYFQTDQHKGWPALPDPLERDQRRTNWGIGWRRSGGTMRASGWSGNGRSGGRPAVFSARWLKRAHSLSSREDGDGLRQCKERTPVSAGVTRRKRRRIFHSTDPGLSP